MTPQEAHKAWRKAERKYRTESRKYFRVQDASEPYESPELIFTEKAAADLTALREAAQAAQDAFVAAVVAAGK